MTAPEYKNRTPGKLRIQKALADAGIASRRAIEEMVLEGRIAVNGVVVRDLPAFVDPGRDEVRVDTQPVRFGTERPIYLLLNKPKGVVCTSDDPRGRRRAIDMVPDIPERIYTVGRLDADSLGLIILTNDGELTEYLTHPRYEVQKTYIVTVDGAVSGEEVERLKAPAHLDGHRTQGAGVKVLRRNAKQSLLEVRLSEGRNREIRRILKRVGHPVRRLKRTAIGPVTDHGLKVGSFRPLSDKELDALRRAGQGRPRKASRTAPRKNRPRRGKPHPKRTGAPKRRKRKR